MSEDKLEDLIHMLHSYYVANLKKEFYADFSKSDANLAVACFMRDGIRLMPALLEAKPSDLVNELLSAQYNFQKSEDSCW